MNHRILLVEDEPSLVLTLSDRLVSEGYHVEAVEDGDTGFNRGLEGSFDLLILDVMLPGKNGFDICRDLRAQKVETPILMLTARGDVVNKVVGLKLGADDYLAKPFEMMELLARVEALLRRSRATRSPDSGGFTFGLIRVDLRRGEVLKDGEAVEISALEYKLLRYFIEHRHTVISRDRLLDKVWGYDATPYTRTVDVHVAALRQKLEPQPSRPQYIVTVHGRGYKFVA